MPFLFDVVDIAEFDVLLLTMFRTFVTTPSLGFSGTKFEFGFSLDFWEFFEDSGSVGDDPLKSLTFDFAFPRKFDIRDPLVSTTFDACGFPMTLEVRSELLSPLMVIAERL
jgi:hypothetical protein